MRLPIIAVCPLIVLASWALTRENNDSPNLQPVTKQPKASNFGTPVEAATPAPVKPIASPETEIKPEFSFGKKTTTTTKQTKTTTDRQLDNQPKATLPETIITSSIADLPPPVAIQPETLLPSSLLNSVNNITPEAVRNIAITPKVMAKAELPPPPPLLPIQNLDILPPPSAGAIGIKLPSNIASINSLNKIQPPKLISIPPTSEIAQTANPTSLTAQYIVEPKLNTITPPPSPTAIAKATTQNPPINISKYIVEPQINKASTNDENLRPPSRPMISMGARTLGNVTANYQQNNPAPGIQIAQANTSTNDIPKPILPTLQPSVTPIAIPTTPPPAVPVKNITPVIQNSGSTQTTQLTIPDETTLEEIRELKNKLDQVEKKKPEFGKQNQGSPGITIVNPAGFGADNNTVYATSTYQSRTRYSNTSDGAIGVGVGLGNARKAVGVEVGYTVASFGGSRDPGAGGVNLKVHKQLDKDLSVAAGWNGAINTGGKNDFENSVYASATKVIRTQDDINKPFSRVAVTAGIGNGRFRTESDVAKDRNTVNPFGSVAVRVAEPVSLITEWTGQDLAVGASIVPIKGKNYSVTITPAVRDIAGAGDGPRFVVGGGVSYKF